ncbi:MAG: hypothetical protein PHD29_09460 [bacterium]|nr:hypothetical protein [bacterium]MDD5757225.1 hypothetical protein [bacterium]
MIDKEEIAKYKKGILIVLGILLLLYLPSIHTFLQVNLGRKFRVYLAEKPSSYKEAKKMALEDFQLEEIPFIQERDISGYDFENAIIYFDPSRKVFDSATYLKLIGRVFVVCLGQQRLYYGTFWTYKIAHGTDTIIAIPDRQGIKIEPGYFGMNEKFSALVHDEDIRKRIGTIQKLR